MRTDELIASLAADTRRSGRPVSHAVLGGLAVGAIVSTILFQVYIGVRPDIVAALATGRFLFKMALVVVTIGLAAYMCLAVARPMTFNVWPVFAALAAVLAVAVAAELAVTPSGEWGAQWLGTNAMMCVVSIPLLSVAPLVLLLTMMRATAPASPTQAGAVIGALSAAIGAALYATHCFDDSPLFVATWYALGALPVVALGAGLGRRLLRW